MSSLRQQTLIEAPVDVIWELVGNPERYPEWWPRMLEVHGERFEEGDEYAQVTRNPIGQVESNFLIEQREELREIRMSCELTGAYADWSLTEAQDGTFVNLEMGMQPKRLGDRLMDTTVGRRYFRRWSQESLKALEDAAQPEHHGASV